MKQIWLIIEVPVAPTNFMRMLITDGQGITKFCRIFCEQVRRRNVEKILIVSPWITSRTQSDYNLQTMMDAMGRSRTVGKDTVILEVATRPPKLDDFEGSGRSHAKAILQLLKHPISRVDIIPDLHTKLYYMEFRNEFMGGSMTVFGSANWTWKAESNYNHETLLEIPGFNESITDMFLHTLNDLAPLIKTRLQSKTLIHHSIEDIQQLCDYLASL